MTFVRTPHAPFVATVRADAALWAAARLIAPPHHVVTCTVLHTLPSGVVSVSRAPSGASRLWLPPGGACPSDLTHGQIALAIRRAREVAITPSADAECFALRALILRVGATTPCPFCEFTPHVATCPVSVLTAGRWLTMEADL